MNNVATSNISAWHQTVGCLPANLYDASSFATAWMLAWQGRYVKFQATEECYLKAVCWISCWKPTTLILDGSRLLEISLYDTICFLNTSVMSVSHSYYTNCNIAVAITFNCNPSMFPIVFCTSRKAVSKKRTHKFKRNRMFAQITGSIAKSFTISSNLLDFR